MLQYADVPLFQATPEMLTNIEHYLDLRVLNDLAHPSWPSRNLTALPFPFLDTQPGAELNSLWWPVGASRWAYGHFLVTDANKVLIEQACYGNSIGGSSTTFVPANFVMSDGTNATPPISLYLLPFRPLAQCFIGTPQQSQPLPNTDTPFWIMTLVDDRYHWWLRSANIDAADAADWNDLFATVATALNISLTTDTIPAAYLDPADDIMSRYDYLPLILDAMAYSVGMRVVRNLNGTVSVQNATTAKAAWSTGVGFAKLYGGQMQLDGTVSLNDVQAILPFNVAVSFPVVRDPFPGCTPYLSIVNLSSLGLTQLSATDTSAFIDDKFFQSTVAAGYDTTGGLLNQSEMDDLATQLATDWVLWQLAPFDVQFMGALPWPVEGMHDVLWSDRGLPMLRVQRTPWNEWQQQVLQSGTYGSAFYAQISANIKANSSTKTGNYYDAFVTTYDSSTDTYSALQPCWLKTPGSSSIISGNIYPGCTLSDGFQGRPVYSLPVGSGGGGGGPPTVSALGITSTTSQSITPAETGGPAKAFPGLYGNPNGAGAATGPLVNTPAYRLIGGGTVCWIVGYNLDPLPPKGSPGTFQQLYTGILVGTDTSGVPIYLVQAWLQCAVVNTPVASTFAGTMTRLFFDSATGFELELGEDQVLGFEPVLKYNASAPGDISSAWLNLTATNLNCSHTMQCPGFTAGGTISSAIVAIEAATQFNVDALVVNWQPTSVVVGPLSQAAFTGTIPPGAQPIFVLGICVGHT